MNGLSSHHNSQQVLPKKPVKSSMSFYETKKNSVGANMARSVKKNDLVCVPVQRAGTSIKTLQATTPREKMNKLQKQSQALISKNIGNTVRSRNSSRKANTLIEKKGVQVRNIDLQAQSVI